MRFKFWPRDIRGAILEYWYLTSSLTTIGCSSHGTTSSGHAFLKFIDAGVDDSDDGISIHAVNDTLAVGKLLRHILNVNRASKDHGERKNIPPNFD